MSLPPESGGAELPPGEPSRQGPAAKVPLKDLFAAFSYIGLTAFGGGGTALIYNAVVRRRGWLDTREFLETSALCRILPGPVFANLAAHVGARLGGVPGGLVALAGVLLPGVALMFALSLAYSRLGSLPGSAAGGVLAGVAAAAVGLILANLLVQAPHGLDSLKAAGLASAVFVTYGLLQWPLLAVLAATVPVGVWMYWGESASGEEGETLASSNMKESEN